MKRFVDNNSLTEAINNNFSKIRSVDLRDAIQSWDGNKWESPKVVELAHEIDDLQQKGIKLGINMPRPEAAGGGQHLQPATFFGEDSFKNLEELKGVMPHTDMMALIRGRQGVGYTPVSAEIQENMIEAYAKRGVKTFRVFDMMNDPENLKATFAATNAYKQKHGGDSITVEGAVSYISAPDKGERAMTLKEYGDYAVKLAKMGADEITIKNYAGVGDKEMPDLIRTIKAGLTEAGYPAMKINLHDHGQKPEALQAALDAGADKVDVAIGMLSGGPSHTDMRSMMYHMLEKEGYDTSRKATQDLINSHPMMRRLQRVEDTIQKIVSQETPDKNGSVSSFKTKRAMLEKFTQGDADHYRVAGGALADLSGRIDERYSKFGKDGKPPGGFPEKDVYFKQILGEAVNLWEKAGQFNTVTPGAKILLEQAMIAADQKIYRQPMTLDKYTNDYVDIAVGRYGQNRGMEKGLGDTKWRDSMMMYRAMKTMNTALREGKISDKQLTDLVMDAGLGVSPTTERVKVSLAGGVKQFDLKDTALEEKLRASSIDYLRGAVTKSGIDEKVKSQIMVELTIGRSPDPTAGMEEGRAKIAALKEKGIDIEALHKSGHRISSPEDMALQAMLMPEKTFMNVVNTAQLAGPQEHNVRGVAATKSHVAAQQARSEAAERGEGRIH